MYEKFTIQAQNAMKMANTVALHAFQDSIESEHMLLGLLKEGGGVAIYVLWKLGVTLSTFEADLERRMETASIQKSMGQLPWGDSAKRIVQLAEAESAARESVLVDTACLLNGILQVECRARSALRKCGLKCHVLQRAIAESREAGITDENARSYMRAPFDVTSPLGRLLKEPVSGIGREQEGAFCAFCRDTGHRDRIVEALSAAVGAFKSATS